MRLGIISKEKPSDLEIKGLFLLENCVLLPHAVTQREGLFRSFYCFFSVT